MPDMQCMKTRVVNVSGAQRRCSYRPKHGRTLSAGEGVTYDGEIWDQFRSTRHRAAFMRDVEARKLAVYFTPSDHFQDDPRDETKVLTIENGVVFVRDPCWGTFSSSIG